MYKFRTGLDISRFGKSDDDVSLQRDVREKRQDLRDLPTLAIGL
jgi:hypothetical protein